MVQTCSAYGCKNRYHKDKEISFHKFPLARPDVCDKWVSAMRRDNFRPTKYSSLCSQHFTQDSFKRECNNRVLKENAVPSVFSSCLRIKHECRESFPPDLHFPLRSDPGEQGEEPVSHDQTAAVSCDHNYTAEDSAWQKKRIEQLEEQVERLRRRLKSSQQRCRRQERHIRRLRNTLGLPALPTSLDQN
ncbi:THAP domain-containing protein 1 [Boleophthalmus pectinirostris]|uniref:THAP domain-containing protein 1 n=1 Tax=Boleophthalmus pectinirostris TaxID=150288 RepID=UPI000A1C604B|nr:THAP domain-containing protein 1 [Boleophthalmus pectinirostris]